jgi:hypothetical protein
MVYTSIMFPLAKSPNYDIFAPKQGNWRNLGSVSQIDASRRGLRAARCRCAAGATSAEFAKSRRGTFRGTSSRPQKHPVAAVQSLHNFKSHPSSPSRKRPPIKTCHHAQFTCLQPLPTHNFRKPQQPPPPGTQNGCPHLNSKRSRDFRAAKIDFITPCAKIQNQPRLALRHSVTARHNCKNPAPSLAPLEFPAYIARSHTHGSDFCD